MLIRHPLNEIELLEVGTLNALIKLSNHIPAVVCIHTGFFEHGIRISGKQVRDSPLI